MRLPAPRLAVRLIPAHFQPFTLRLAGVAALAATLLFGLAPAVAQSVVFVSAQTTFGNGLSSASGVAVDAAGDVFVVDSVLGQVVKFPAGGGAAVTVVTGLNGPLAIAADAAGDVFIADSGNNQVVKVPAGGVATAFATGLSNPSGVAVDALGNVYVSDTGNNQVLKFTSAGGPSSGATPVGAGLTSPTGLAVDATGNVFIAEPTTVAEVPGASSQTTVGSGFVSPQGLAVDAAGNLYVADSGSNTVVEIPAAVGAAQTTMGSGLTGPQAVAVHGSGNVYNAPANASQLAEVQTSAVNFGSANVCPAPQTTPAPCSASLTLTYNVTAAVTFSAAPAVLTQGAPNLDLTLDVTTCMGSPTAPTSCTVGVNFAPLAPGVHMGAVQLVDDSGNVLVQIQVHGIGQGPAVAFNSSAKFPLGPGVTYAPVGVAVDGSENVFIADNYYSRILKIAKLADGTVAQTTVPTTGLVYPDGLAVDGAGDLFIADLVGNRRVEVAPNGVQTTVASGLNLPTGIAVDGAGDLFIVAYASARVVKILAGEGPQTTVGTGFGVVHSVAVDGLGDVFIADPNNHRLVEVTPLGVQSTVGIGLINPQGLAVDGAGDVFISDVGDGQVDEVPAGCTASSCQIVVASGFIDATALAVDSTGNLFVGDTKTNQTYEVPRSQAPSLTFASTAVGSTSIDSPQSIAVQNIGNQPLTGSLALSLGANFVAGPDSPVDCTPGFSRAAGASCNFTVSFQPQSSGALSGTAAFTDNALNASPSATQSVTLTGTGTAGTATISISNLPASGVYGGSFTPTYAYTGDGTPSVTSTTLSTCTVTAGLVSYTGAGTCMLTANATAGATSAAVNGTAQSFTIGQADATVTVTGYSVPYDTTAHTATVTAIGVNGENLIADVALNTTHTAAGTYSDTWTSTDPTGNYNNITNGTVSDSITKINAKVSPDALGKIYGTTDPALTGTPLGFLSADGVTATYARTPGESVLGGPYTISATLNPAAAPVNYNITYNTAPFTISPAAASVTPNAAGKSYGGVDPALTGTLAGFLPADGVAASYTWSTCETVAGGPYIISATLTPTAVLSNYNIAYNTALFTINKLAASVTPNAAGKTYGGVDPAFTGALSGFLAGDGVTASYGRVAGETVAGGPYAISATLSPTAPLANYTITYNTALFTISKANATISVTPYSVVYNAAAHTATGTATGVGWVSLTGLVLNTTHTAAGSYTTDSWTFTDTTGNYNNATAIITDTITKAPATISISNIPATATAGGNFVATFTYTGDNGVASVISSTPATCTAVGAAVTFVSAGTCTLTAQAAAGTNYAAATGTAQSFTIAAATTGTATLTPSAPNFGSVQVGTGAGVLCVGGAPCQIFTVTNTGIVTITGIGQGVVSGDASYVVVRALSSCGPSGNGQLKGLTTLKAGAKCSVTVQFRPLISGGVKTGSVSVSGSFGTQSASVTGTATVLGVPSFTRTNGGTVGAWSTATGARTITVTNTGATGSTLVMTELPAVANLTGGTQFARTGGTCTATTSLSLNQACTVIITRTRPATNPASTGTLTLHDTGVAAATQTLNLSGN